MDDCKELVGAALRIVHLGEQMVKLGNDLYDRSIVLAIDSSDAASREPRVVVSAREEEWDGS